VSASKVRWLELSQLSLCSEFDKENSMEFLLIPLPTYTLCYCGYALTLLWSSCYFSHVTYCDCDPWHDHLWHCDKVTWLFPVLHLVVVSPIKRKRKRKEKNINNDLAVLPSHDTMRQQSREILCSFHKKKTYILLELYIILLLLITFIFDYLPLNL